MNLNGPNIRWLFVRAFYPTLPDIRRRLRRIEVNTTATTSPKINIRWDASVRLVLIAEIEVADNMITPVFTAIHGFDACCFSCASAEYADGTMTKIIVNLIVYA